ncbi:endonuclease/exonuclease/phosphatase family protein [Vibrio nigripulchritudo]|uniref:endonuclease/exonuclease/phosphatase family protein n=1 Tax=Vibrio nigripulchritudo TaxID=28173 RepID=UPI0005F9EFBF|nr:endonuclease/exonuclease/phosphatase family protein [Vibrio nigripulchritudo]KJY69013.1 hypothetical protein TW74_24490 [Vibrio nigripulchritudo]
MKKTVLGAGLVAAFIMVAHWSLFSVPEKPVLISLDSAIQRTDEVCYQTESPEPIDQNGSLNLLVWNIYKQNRDSWSEELSALSESAQLVMLQEVSLNPTFLDWLTEHSWASNQVSAFKLFETSAGVLNLTPHFPLQACAYTQIEPWLRLPKSALYATYALSNGQTLATVNIHAVNFTIGTKEFEAQIDALKSAVESHQGPIIIAGDFNTWSEERTQELKKRVELLGLKEARFSPDQRTEFVTGWPLDHVFYRDLNFKSAEAPLSGASDHSPMWVEFSLVK